MSRPRLSIPQLIRLAILTAWILGYAWLVGTGRYQIFIRAGLWPLLASGLLLLLLFFAAVALRRNHQAVGARGLLHWGVRLGLLLLPLIYMTGGSRTGLGSDAFAMRRAAGQTLTSRELRRGASKSPGGSTTVLDLINDFEQYDGKPVAVDGLVYQGKQPRGILFVVFRFVIVCCAADAVPAGVPVRFAGAASLPEDIWVRVTGVARRLTVNGEESPGIVAEHVEQIEPPSSIYLVPW